MSARVANTDQAVQPIFKETTVTFHRAIRLMEALAATVAAQQTAKLSRIKERRRRRRRVARSA